MQFEFMELDRRVARYRTHRFLAPQAWKTFNDKLDLSWLVHDYALDGFALTEEDLRRALGRATPKHHCDSVLLEGIRRVQDGIRLTRRTAQSQESLTLDDLKRFHTILWAADHAAAGRYRKVEGPIIPYLHEVTRTPSISYRLRRLAEDLPNITAQQHPIRAAALVHHEFMSIWPFDERSSTAGRLLMNYVLLRGDYPPAIIHAVDRQDYYAALAHGPEALARLLVGALGASLRSAEQFLGHAEALGAQP